jgi:hypothetical protein
MSNQAVPPRRIPPFTEGRLEQEHTQKQEVVPVKEALPWEDIRRKTNVIYPAFRCRESAPNASPLFDRKFRNALLELVRAVEDGQIRAGCVIYIDALGRSGFVVEGVELRNSRRKLFGLLEEARQFFQRHFQDL